MKQKGARGTVGTNSRECPNCGSEMKYSGKEKKYTCERCSSSFAPDELGDERAREEAARADRAFWGEMALFGCKSCKTVFAVSKGTELHTCCRCQKPLEPMELSGKLRRPAYVIPFNTDQQTARDTLRRFARKHLCLPRGFTEKIEDVTGVYVPFWRANVHTSVTMEALGKKSNTWTTGNARYTETKEYAAARQAKILLSGLPAETSSKLCEGMLEELEPFDYNALRPFERADAKDCLIETGAPDTAAMFGRLGRRAAQVSDQIARKSLSDYDSVSVTNSDIRVMSTDWELLLLPVWYMAFPYHGEIYAMALNGQTGKLHGTPPLSKLKLGVWGTVAGLLTAGAAALLGVLLL